MKWFPIPLRYSIPVLLILFSIIFGIYSFQREMKWSYSRHEIYEKQEATAIGNNLSKMLEYLYRQGDDQMVQILVIQACSDPNVRLACIVDENNRLVHACSFERAKQQLPSLIAYFNSVRNTKSSVVEFAEDRQELVLFYPIDLEGKQSSINVSRIGILHLEYDLSRMKEMAYADAKDRLQEIGIVTMFVIGAIWVFFYATTTRRLRKLLAAVRRFAQGEKIFNSGLGGTDELVEISRALEKGIKERTEAILKTNENLRKSEERFRTFTTLSPVGIYVTDTDGRCIFVNQRWCEMAGLTPEEAFGDGWIKGLHPDDRERVTTDWNRMEQSRGIWGLEYRFKTPNGTVTWVYGNATPLADASGQTIGYIGTNADITDRKRAEEQLLGSELRYRTVADFTYDWEYWLSPEGTFRYVSPSSSRITGYSAQEFVDNPAFFAQIVYTEDKTLWENHQKYRGRHGAQELQFRIVTRSGEVRWIEHICQPVIGENGEFLGVRASNRDITDRRQAEEALHTSEEKLKFLSSQLIDLQELERKTIAAELHDSISQTLSAAKFGLENSLLQMHNSPADHDSTKLEASIEMLKSAIDEVRRISTDLRPSMLDDLGVVLTIGWFLREFQRIYITISIEQQIEIQENAVPDNLKIVLYRIIQEALNNVAKHSRADRVRVSLKNTGETLTLTIEDNGEGFNQDTSLAVANVQGGLGIISMRERAAFSGGFFNITSVKGQGTIIAVSWPC